MRRVGVVLRAGSSTRGLLHRLVAAVLHRHRVDPDLSALVSFPSCRCGALLWPETSSGRDRDPRRSAAADGRVADPTASAER